MLVKTSLREFDLSSNSVMKVNATSESNIAPLLLLPTEVLGIVCHSLCQRSLNALTQTCKTLDLVAAPKLYHCIILRVPMRWSKLPSFESLISSSGKNFRYVGHVVVTTQQGQLRNCQRGGLSKDADQGCLFDFPPDFASDALNVRIRLLLARLPKQRLQSFRSISCPTVRLSFTNA